MKLINSLSIIAIAFFSSNGFAGTVTVDEGHIESSYTTSVFGTRYTRTNPYGSANYTDTATAMYAMYVAPSGKGVFVTFDKQTETGTVRYKSCVGTFNESDWSIVNDYSGDGIYDPNACETMNNLVEDYLDFSAYDYGHTKTDSEQYDIEWSGYYSSYPEPVTCGAAITIGTVGLIGATMIAAKSTAVTGGLSYFAARAALQLLIVRTMEWMEDRCITNPQ